MSAEGPDSTETTPQSEPAQIDSSESQQAGAMQRCAFVLGYTGETGKELVKELVKSDVIKRLVLIGRREVKLDDTAPKTEQKIIDFDKPEEFKSVFEGCDVGYSCLGTTRGKAGKEGFIKVDLDYVVNTAKVAKEAGCKHLHLVSSQGANANSFFLYPQIKGQAEAALKDIGFDRMSIYRPALLMCDRSESRVGESIIRTLVKPIAALSPTLISCPTATLAKAMLNNTLNDTGAKIDLFENKDIFKLADLTYFQKEKK